MVARLGTRKSSGASARVQGGTADRRARSMTGLSILYASEAAKERDWAVVPDRDRTGRLREVHWARRAEPKSGRKWSVIGTLNWRPDRTAIGRRSDEPGDGFVYLVSMTPRVEDWFEWLEVTEVFTTVPASQIEGAMRVWNGISDKHPVDFDEFRWGLPRGRPSRVEQRRAADRVIAQIERKQPVPKSFTAGRGRRRRSETARRLSRDSTSLGGRCSSCYARASPRIGTIWGPQSSEAYARLISAGSQVPLRDDPHPGLCRSRKNPSGGGIDAMLA